MLVYVFFKISVLIKDGCAFISKQLNNHQGLCVHHILNISSLLLTMEKNDPKLRLERKVHAIILVFMSPNIA